MKAFGFREHGGLDRLGELDLPTPVAGDGEVRVRIRAGALNRLDRFVLEGIPGVPIERPHAVGSDGAGTVDAMGPNVVDLSLGDRVLINPGLWDGTCEACRADQESLCRNYRIVGEHTQGTFAEFVVVPRRNVWPLPPRFSFADGAAAPLVFQTAWRALVHVGGVRPGERVAIIGAGGGVATAAIQVARLQGARVAVISRSAEKGERARQLGAESVIVPSDAMPMERALWDWSEKRGVDLVFDSVGAETVPRSLKSLARGGRIVVIGATTGPVVSIDLRTLFWRQASIRGSTMASAREFEEAYRALSDGRLRPVIDAELPWEEATRAFPRLQAPDLFGKVVVSGPPGR